MCEGLSGGDDRGVLRWPQRGVAFFGGVPRSILYDNTRRAVARKGNDKGKVEGLAGFIRRNFLVPVPRVESIEALNDDLAGQCRRRQAARLRGHGGDDRRAPRTGSPSSATATPRLHTVPATSVPGA